MWNINTEIQSAPNNDVYAEWIDDWKLYARPYDLPDAPNADGRPVWEPPVFDYSEWIDQEEYEKKREAMLKWTNGDVARTTDIMDIDTEFGLLSEYWCWAGDNAESAVNSESRQFFKGLHQELYRDCNFVFDEWGSLGGVIVYKLNKDGTYRAERLYLSDSSPEDSSSEHRDNIPDNASNRSISPPPSGDFNSNSIISTLPRHPVAEHNRISSPKDEAEELAWLDSLDASPSTPTTTDLAQQFDGRPLAVRLMSLRSITATDKPTHDEMEAGKGDDLD